MTPTTFRAIRFRLANAALLLGLLLASGMFAPADVSAGRRLQVSNAALQVGVDSATGQIVELIDRRSKQNLAGATTDFGGLWEADFAGLSPLTPASAGAFDAVPVESGLKFSWSGFGLARAPELSVEVTVRLDAKQALSRWQIALCNTGSLEPTLIRFPRLLHIPPQPDERLAVPVWMGQEAANPRALLRDKEGKPKRLEWSYPGQLSAQCLALSGDRAGLYAACDDTAGYLKDFAVFGDDSGGLNFEVVHKPESEGTGRTQYPLPYSVVLGVVHGDWFNAAALYRSWATNQPWARESRLKRGLTPSWVTNTALWVWNRGRSPGVLDPAITLQQKLGLPVSVFWHWWHGCAYDAGFPEYFPPREGDASFKTAVQRAHEQDVRAIVYMNQRLWGMTTASWTNEDAARFAVKAADGQVKPEVYNTFTKSPCASMCMGTEFWRGKYAGLAAQALDSLGVDGIYMDQACSSLACFDPAHGHSIGGGTYWMAGFESLASNIRARCEAHGEPALAGEGCGENWLPYLDLMLSLQVSRERYGGPGDWQTIPFFHAIYHGYGVFYGNYASLTLPPYDELWPAEFAPQEPLKLLDRKFSRQFCLEQARAFVWGQQPTLANFLASQLRERPDEIAFVMRLARLRRAALEFLQDGVMLAPPLVEAAIEEIPMSRLSIYAGQQGALAEFRKTVPQVLAANWQAPDGSAAIAVVNVSDALLKPVLRFEASASGLSGRYNVRRIDERGRTLLGPVRGKTLRLQPELAPLEACVLELARD